MLHRDYLLEVIARFVDAVTIALRGLSPDSLVTMMLLSGMGDSLASYVSYALDRVGDAYDNMGDKRTAELRWDQAQAVAEAFNCDPNTIPEEFADLERELSAAE